MAAVRFGSVQFAPETVPVHPVRFASDPVRAGSCLPAQHAPVPVRPVPVRPVRFEWLVRPVPVRNGPGSPVPVQFAAIVIKCP